MSDNPTALWHARFSGEDYLFGEGPNAFLASRDVGAD
jgi:hypothetical protein